MISQRHDGHPTITTPKEIGGTCCCVTVDYGRLTFYGICENKAKHRLRGIGNICGVHRHHLLRTGDIKIFVKYNKDCVFGRNIIYQEHCWAGPKNDEALKQKKLNEAKYRRRAEIEKHYVAVRYGLTVDQLDQAVSEFKKRMG